MGVPIKQQFKVGSYIVKQRLKGNKRYPLVLMLEPLFRCNLACPGCGKIDYPDEILNKRISVAEALEAVDECGVPVVSIAGGEPLIHKEIDQIVEGIIDRGVFVYLCTNALLMEKKMHLFKPSDYFTWSIHLDGLEEEHDHAVDQKGVFKRTIAAIKKAKDAGFRVNINTTLFDGTKAEDVAEFLDYVSELGIDGVTISPGYAYERAPDQAHFLSREKTKNLFRDLFRIGKQNDRKWPFSQSSLFLDFLAGNQEYRCTPWGNPTRNIFGWQRPCYLLNEGYVSTFKELMEETDWDSYGTGNYEKCANCMVHCGYEATAANDAVQNPLKTFLVSRRGPKTEGPMAPEIPLAGQRPAEYIFDSLVMSAVNELHQARKEDVKAETTDAA